ncbi:hypothetical protein MSM1_01615 [Mycobacterium sp. SM1]|nr:hypothetical protein [Mycobacterium sp. SM1]
MGRAGGGAGAVTKRCFAPLWTLSAQGGLLCVDRGEGRRRWPGLDWGTVQVVLEAEAPR